MSGAQEKESKRRIKRLAVAGAAVLLVCVLALLTAFVPFSVFLPAYVFPAREAGEVRLHFLDVGQGDCTIVEFPDGDVLVVDAGDGSFPHNNKLLRYIKGLRPARLSLLLTHADADHYGGFSALFGAFDVQTCYLPFSPAESGSYRAFLDALEKEGCPTQSFTRRDTIEKETGYIVCLSPEGEDPAEDISGSDSGNENDNDNDNDNDNSAVLYLNFGGVTALLCGDISSARERALVQEYTRAADVFDSGNCTVRLQEIDLCKAPHHGSSYSSSQEFLELLRPKNYIVSCGRDNSYRLPAEEALARFRVASPGGKIYRTDELGDIVVRIRGANYKIAAREEL